MDANDTPMAPPISEGSAPKPTTWETGDAPAEGVISDTEALNALKVLEERRKERRKKKIVKGAIAAAVVVAVGLGVFFATQNHSADSEDTGPVVETDVVVREDFSIPISGNGSLQAKSSTAVNPEVEGTVTEVFAQEGDQVEKGTTLFTIESEEVEKDIEDAADKVKEAEQAVSEAQAAVGTAQSALNKANSAYKSVKSKADKAKKKYQEQKKKQDAAKEKADAAGKKEGDASGKKAGEIAYNKEYDKVYADAIAENPDDKDAAKKAATNAAEVAYDKAYREAYDSAYDTAYKKVKIPKISDYDKDAYAEDLADAKAEVDAASAELTAAQADVRAAQGEVSAAQADYAKAEAQREKCTITAPQAGTLVAFKVGVGDTVGSSDGESSDSSVRVSDLSALRLSIEVNETDIAKVEVGQSADVVPQAFSDITLKAKVTDIAESASGMDEGGGYDGGSVVFGVKLEIDEPDDRLKPGMSASVKILTSEVKNALVVPTNALIEEEDGTYVDVVVDEETLETKHKKVKIKVKDNSRAVVEKGLQEGDVVVVSSIDFTMDEEEDEFDSDMMEEDADETLEDDVELEDAEEFEA